MSARRATLLGIDVGTTGLRGAVLDSQGHLLAQASEPYPPATPRPGWAETDADGWWRALRAVASRLSAEAPIDEVEAVGVTGQAPTLVPVDGEGKAIRPAILWLDIRADAEARRIDGALGPGNAEAIGGNRMHPYYLGPKLAWMRAHEPEALDRAAMVLQSHAFVVLRLTDQAACDPSTAMLCAPLFDARHGSWSEAGAQAVGVPLRLLPPVVPAHQVIGAVTAGAARETGLRRGTPVVSGGGDFAASALGAGVIEEGQVSLMLGTAGNLLFPMKRPRFDARLINSHHVGCGRWLALGGTLCGAALEWFRRACAPDAGWEALEAEAAAVDVRTMGSLVTLPYFQGERTPVWDERARAVFSGIDASHGRGHLYRSLLEGIALGFRHSQTIAQEQGIEFSEVIAANGAGKSALLRQILADALGLPLAYSTGRGATDGTVAGAAILAGLGAGVLGGPESARAWRSSSAANVAVHHPEPRAHDRLCALFARRLALYEAVRTIPDLGALAGLAG